MKASGRAKLAVLVPSISETPNPLYPSFCTKIHLKSTLAMRSKWVLSGVLGNRPGAAPKPLTVWLWTVNSYSKPLCEVPHQAWEYVFCPARRPTPAKTRDWECKPWKWYDMIGGNMIIPRLFVSCDANVAHGLLCMGRLCVTASGRAHLTLTSFVPSGSASFTRGSSWSKLPSWRLWASSSLPPLLQFSAGSRSAYVAVSASPKYCLWQVQIYLPTNCLFYLVFELFGQAYCEYGIHAELH